MAQYEFTHLHIEEICQEKGDGEDQVLSWFPSVSDPDRHKAWSQKNIRDSWKVSKTIQKTSAEMILKILKGKGFERSLRWLEVQNDTGRPLLPGEENYSVNFPSDMTKEDVERLTKDNSLAGFYRLTRHKLSDAEPGYDYVVDYIEIYAVDGDIRFTLFAICSTSQTPIEFVGSVRKLGSILMLAGRREPDDFSPLSFKILFLEDEGGASIARSRVRWGIMTTKSLTSKESSPVSTRILLEKTHKERPDDIPEPCFQDQEYFKETYKGKYTKSASLYHAVLSMISNNIEKYAANMNKPTLKEYPDLALSVSQGTTDAISGYLVKNMGPLIEVE